MSNTPPPAVVPDRKDRVRKHTIHLIGVAKSNYCSQYYPQIDLLSMKLGIYFSAEGACSTINKMPFIFDENLVTGLSTVVVKLLFKYSRPSVYFLYMSTSRTELASTIHVLS